MNEIHISINELLSELKSSCDTNMALVTDAFRTNDKSGIEASYRQFLLAKWNHELLNVICTSIKNGHNPFLIALHIVDFSHEFTVDLSGIKHKARKEFLSSSIMNAVKVFKDADNE